MAHVVGCLAIDDTVAIKNEAVGRDISTLPLRIHLHQLFQRALSFDLEEHFRPVLPTQYHLYTSTHNGPPGSSTRELSGPSLFSGSSRRRNPLCFPSYPGYLSCRQRLRSPERLLLLLRLPAHEGTSHALGASSRRPCLWGCSTPRRRCGRMFLLDVDPGPR